jgi:hypothetical protein
LKKEGCLASSFIEILIIGDTCQATQTPCAVLCKVYAAPHMHPQQTNILQHSRCGRNRVCHIKTGAKAATESKNQGPSNAVMWQFKISHIPKRKTNKINKE